MGHSAPGVEVITGSMFSGKTDELIRRLRRARIAGKDVKVLNPSLDIRYAAGKVTSHAGTEFEATPVERAAMIGALVRPTVTVVAVDEAQFFDDDLITVVQDLAHGGRRGLVAGLDTDFRGEPFGPMPHLIALAGQVDKLHSIFIVCGEPAARTQ